MFDIMFGYVLRAIQAAENKFIKDHLKGHNRWFSRIFNFRMVYDRETVSEIFKSKEIRSFENKFQNIIFRRSSTTAYPKSESDKQIRNDYVTKRFNDKQFHDEYLHSYFKSICEQIGDISIYNPLSSTKFSTMLMVEKGFKLNDPLRFYQMVKTYNCPTSIALTFLRQNKFFRKIHDRFYPNYPEGIKQLDKMVMDIVYKRDGWDYSSGSWLEEVLKDFEEGRLKKESVISEVLDIMIPSYLVSLLLSWSLYHVSKNQIEIEKIRKNKKWAKYCIMETLRLTPTSFMVLKSKNGETPSIKKALFGKCPAMNIISIYNIHRNKDYYDQPESFNPSRFIGGISKFENVWLPFGGGVNLCPGRAFSMKVCSELLYMIVDKYDITTTCQIEEEFMFTLAPKQNYVPIEFRKRTINDY